MIFAKRGTGPVYYLKVRIAGLNIEVEFKNRSDFSSFKPYLFNFDTPDFVVNATDEKVNTLYNILSKDMSNKSIIGDVLEIAKIEEYAIFEETAKRMLDYQTILMHGAVVSKDGYAYMFTAPSGTGKTTRIKLWKDEYPDSIIINGDKPFIKITDSSPVACGSPWCGKEGWNTNIMVPLRAIFLLERSDSENYLEELTFEEALPFLLQQIPFPSDIDGIQKMSSLIDSLVKKVKVYRFTSTPTSAAIRLAYETARPQ